MYRFKLVTIPALLFFFSSFTLLAQNTEQIVGFSNLAVQQYDAGDFKSAKESIEKAIGLFGPSTPDSIKGKTYVSQCKILFYNALQKDALSAQRKAVHYLEKAFGRNHPFVADEIYNLAFLLNFVEAKNDSNLYYLNEVLQIYKNLNQALDVGETLRYIGEAQRRAQNYAEASQLLLEAVEVLEAIQTDQPELIRKDSARYFVELSNTYLGLATISQTLSDQDKLWIYIQKSQDLLEKEGKKYPRIQREALENQARLYQYLGYFEEAKAILKSLLDSEFANENYRVKWRFNSLMAQLLSRHMDAFEEALVYWKAAAAVELSVGGQLDNNKVQRSREMAYCHLKLNEFEKANELLEIALPIAQQMNIAGDSTLFALAITKKKISFIQVEQQDQWQQKIKAILPAFSQQPQSIDNQLGQASYELYQLILEPLVKDLPQNIKQLFIIPDGLLANLPFAALCTESVNNTNYGSWPYLIKKFSIAYLPFAGNINSFKKRNLKERNIACFAPQYQDNFSAEQTDLIAIRSLVRDGFYALPGAQKEVSEIQKLFGEKSKLFTAENINKSQFKRQAPDFQLLHLAMHAMPDYTHPTQSYLFFPGTEAKGEKLSLLELSNIPLKAEHVALSACHTSSGPYQSGEGIISMAYTLQELGVATTLSNDWAAPDQIAPSLINAYYENLLEGLKVDQALREAQLKHLEKSGPALEKHPFYWAGMKIHGNTNPLFQKRPISYYVAAFLVLCLILFFIYRSFFKRRAPAA